MACSQARSIMALYGPRSSTTENKTYWITGPALTGRVMSLKVIHFQYIFLIYFYLKRLIYVQKYGITNQTVIQQGIQEKEEFLQKKEQQVDKHH